MKVFWLTKHTDEKNLLMYRCIEEELIFSLNIENPMGFNNLFITNPKDSNMLYVINYFSFMTEEGTTITLYSAEDLKLSPKHIAEIPLEISCLSDCEEASAFTELCTLSNSSNLSKDRYIILLPGGTLFIKASKLISKANLALKYIMENL